MLKVHGHVLQYFKRRLDTHFVQLRMTCILKTEEAGSSPRRKKEEDEGDLPFRHALGDAWIHQKVVLCYNKKKKTPIDLFILKSDRLAILIPVYR